MHARAEDPVVQCVKDAGLASVVLGQVCTGSDTGPQPGLIFSCDHEKLELEDRLQQAGAQEARQELCRFWLEAASSLHRSARCARWNSCLHLAAIALAVMPVLCSQNNTLLKNI